MPAHVPSDPTPEARRFAAVSHLAAAAGLVVPFGTVLGPLVAWIVFRDEHPFVDGQARHAVDVNLAFGAAELLLALLAFFLTVLAGEAGAAVVFLGLFVVLGLAHAGVVIYLAVKASDGVDVHVPFRIPVMGR